MTLKASIHEAEEGGYWAEVPALPGCVTQGVTVEEVTFNLREAIEGWLSVETTETAGAQNDRVIEFKLVYPVLTYPLY
jgi:predicted RNase H-like HicB family nuclease